VAKRLSDLSRAAGNPRTAADPEMFAADALLTLGYEDEAVRISTSAGCSHVELTGLELACVSAVARELKAHA
jgi:hypothetical protein